MPAKVACSTGRYHSASRVFGDDPRSTDRGMDDLDCRTLDLGSAFKGSMNINSASGQRQGLPEPPEPKRASTGVHRGSRSKRSCNSDEDDDAAAALPRQVQRPLTTAATRRYRHRRLSTLLPMSAAEEEKKRRRKKVPPATDRVLQHHFNDRRCSPRSRRRNGVSNFN